MTAIYKIRFIAKTIFYLPGTLLHEVAHLVGFKLMGFRNLKLSVIPKNILSSYEITMGTATASLPDNYSKIRLIFPSIFPKIFIVALYYFLKYYNIIELEAYSNAFTVSIYYEHLSLLDYRTYLILYVFSQLIWASSLSFQDWKMFFTGLFSLGGMIVVVAIFIAALSFQYM